MEWILVYECNWYQVFRDKEGKRKRIVDKKDNSEKIVYYDWSHDELA